MDELPKSMRGDESFFDDGDDKIIGRVDEGENFAEAYDLQRADPSQLSNPQETSQTKLNADDFDFRMEGRANPKAPKGLKQKSVHTGPKGVKKDYEDSKEALRIQKTFDKMRSERAINQATSSQQAFYIDDIVNEMTQLESTAYTEEEKERAKLKQRMKSRHNNPHAHESQDDIDEDSDDERLFAKFREERVKNIQASLPCYGSYMKANTLEELAELLKNNHEACYVVVHVYQNKNPTCISVHLTFEAIASQFPHVAFIRMRSDVAFNSYDNEALPTLLLYKGSKLHKSIISLSTLIGKTPTDRELVKFLADQGVLRIPSMGLENISIKDKKKWKEDYEEGNSDEESHDRSRKSEGPIKTSNLFGTDPYSSGFSSSILNYNRMSNVCQDEGLDSDDVKDVNDDDNEFFFDM